MTRKTMRAMALMAVLSLTAGTLTVSAQAPADKRTYIWYADMVSLDPAAKAVTLKAPVEAPVMNYVTQFKPGEKLMVTWAANAGKPETGPIMYVAKYEVMKASKVDVGYILPAEFVSADTAAKTLTFKAIVPDAAVAAFKGATAGQGIKVTSPMSQPSETAGVASVEVAARATPFVRDAPPAPPKPEERKKPGA